MLRKPTFCAFLIRLKRPYWRVIGFLCPSCMVAEIPPNRGQWKLSNIKSNMHDCLIRFREKEVKIEDQTIKHTSVICVKRLCPNIELSPGWRGERVWAEFWGKRRRKMTYCLIFPYVSNLGICLQFILFTLLMPAWALLTFSVLWLLSSGAGFDWRSVTAVWSQRSVGLWSLGGGDERGASRYDWKMI